MKRGLTPDEDRALGCIEEGVITKVEPYADGGGWSLSYGDCMGVGMRDVGTEPKAGDLLTCFGIWGRPIHGQALNGEVLWYSSPEEMDAKHARMVADMDAKARTEFEEHRAQLDDDYQSLPPLFRMRIDRFRAANPDFRWKHESYEMFICTQAVVLGDWALSEAAGDPEKAVEVIDRWNRINSKENDPPYDYAAQKAAVPGWSDGHSGNTHGCAVMLAKEHVRGSERVPLYPGALSPITGSADYSESGDG